VGFARTYAKMESDFDFEEVPLEITYGVPASTVAALFERGEV